MGRDSSSKKIYGKFLLTVDKDHKGNFRGLQYQSENFRGYHYHVENPDLTQLDIMKYFEYILETQFKASKISIQDPNKLGIGFINDIPKYISLWELKETVYIKKLNRFEIIYKGSCVLWIGQLGKLHIEANKINGKEHYILKKAEIVKILENWKVNKNEES